MSAQNAFLKPWQEKKGFSMNRRLKYLHLKYDPGTRPFLDIVETVLKRAGSQQETNLTQLILSAVNESGLSLMPVRNVSQLKQAFPIARICHDESRDRWFITPRKKIMSVEDLLDITLEDIDKKDVEAYTGFVNLRIDTALEETRFDKMLAWLDSYAVLRNEKAACIDAPLIQPLLFSITRAVRLLAEIGNRDLIEQCKAKYVSVKCEKSVMEKTSFRGLLSASENAFFDEQSEVAEKNRRIRDICDRFVKSGGDIEKTAAVLEGIARINLKKVVSALLNLRKNVLIAEVNGYEALKSITVHHFTEMESRFLELERLIRDRRVRATKQILGKLTPGYLRMAEAVFLNPENTIEDRETAFNHALGRVDQRKAYANFQAATIYELSLKAVRKQDPVTMESHLLFYRRIQENHFPIFQKSIARIQREIDEIRRRYQQKQMGL